MEPVGSACPRVTGEGQAHSGTKSSGLFQRTSATQWGDWYSVTLSQSIFCIFCSSPPSLDPGLGR